MNPDTPVSYRDRHHAGLVLAGHLAHLAGRDDLLVLALPRGGVAVGFEVARALHAPLDVFVVRKIGLPGHEEFAIGAIASGGVRVMNRLPLPVDGGQIEQVVAREQAELARRERLYRGGRPAPAIAGRTVVLVDDGLATGATMRAAAQAIRPQQPRWLCIAVPVGAPDACDALAALSDEVVCPARPEDFVAVSRWYQSFSQATDAEVQALLARAAGSVPGQPPAP